MREPSCEFGFEHLAEVRTHIEISNPRTTTEPLQNSTAGEVHVKCSDVDRHGAQRLERIECDLSADSVRFLNDGLCVVDERCGKSCETGRAESPRR